jgi:hypothetical protein
MYIKYTAGLNKQKYSIIELHLNRAVEIFYIRGMSHGYVNIVYVSDNECYTTFGIILD